jgi:hypothetical protein
MTSLDVELPDAETVFHHYFGPWFPPEDPRNPKLRSDLEQVELEKGQHIRVLSPLTEEGRTRMLAQLERTSRAALQDLPSLLKVQGAADRNWLTALETYLAPEYLQNLLRVSPPEKVDNQYLVLCCESGALIAEVLRREWPALQWIADFPYFESSLFDLNTKVMIPVFHWAVKVMSGDERKPLADKVAATVEYLQQGHASPAS